MFETLYGKVFTILGSQLLLTTLVAMIALSYIQAAYEKGVDWVDGVEKANGDIDLHITRINGGFFWGLLIVDIALFLVLLFVGRSNIAIGIPVFTLWSIVTGIQLSMIMINYDENLAGRVLGLTASITILMGFIGVYSGIDFSFLGGFLFVALIFLIIANVARLFIKMSSASQRIVAAIGVGIFTLYLLYDFNRLEQASLIADKNTWEVAMQFSIKIYLDIINLFIELLKLLSK